MLKAFINSLKHRGLKDVTSPAAIKAYLEANEIRKHGLNIPVSEVLAYAEQLLYRLYGECHSCAMRPKCPVCGCTMPDAMTGPKFKCKREPVGGFPKMMSAEDWSQMVEIDNIEIVVQVDRGAYFNPADVAEDLVEITPNEDGVVNIRKDLLIPYAEQVCLASRFDDTGEFVKLGYVPRVVPIPQWQNVKNQLNIKFSVNKGK